MRSTEEKIPIGKLLAADSFDDIFAFSSSNGTIPQLENIVHGDDAHAPIDYKEYMYPALIQQYENTAPVFYRNLSVQNREVLHTIEMWIRDSHIDISVLARNDLHETLAILRFLRANQFSRSKTKLHIEKAIAWRLQMGSAELAKQKPEDILGCSIRLLTEVFPHWHSGYDKTGRPVLYKKYGRFEAGQIKRLVGGSFSSIEKYHIWEQEACGRLCLAQSMKRKEIVETVTTVLDIEGMKMKQVNGDFIRLVSLLADVDGTQYPETMGRIFVINATPSFALAWQMIKPWVVAATASKMKILGGSAEYIPVLREFIGEENLPANYGGTLPPLSVEVHPYAETMNADFSL
jgi:hypothetical protein